MEGTGNPNIHKELEDASPDEVDGQCLGTIKNKNEKLNARDTFEQPRIIPGKFHSRMPVDKYSTHYNMEHKNRGMALIFNHEEFELQNGKKLKARSATDKDSKSLKECLLNLGFDVQVFKDLNCDDVEFQIKQIAELDHTHHDCLLICVLSHGDMGILYARDTTYKPETLWDSFTADKCPSLAGKPKIFFLQACRGGTFDGGVHLIRTETDGAIYSYRIPTQADFLIVYATVEGHYSWRSTTTGSWFIQTLCSELNQKAHKMDLLTILTFVSQRVAIDFESNVPDNISMSGKKQVPCVVSRLTRLIQFKPRD